MSEMSTPFLDPLIAALRQEEGEDRSYPVGGAVAAVVTGLAASLAAGAADRSRSVWDEAAGARAQAQTLRRRTIVLAERDAAAYAVAREALAGRGVDSMTDAATGERARDRELGDAVRRAAEPLLELAASAADVAHLAALVAARGADDVRADAVVAALLASASADAAARLVQVNLVVGGEQQLAVRARQHAEDAARAASSAREVEL